MMTYGSSSWRDYILEAEEAFPFVERALELGINFFDTADIYSLGKSEEATGEALKKLAKRDEVVIATKVCGQMSDDPNNVGLSRKHIFDSIDNSLRRLQTDFVDLYQIHRWDYDTPIEETLEALNDIVRAGKVRYIGASSMFAWQFLSSLNMSDASGWSRFVSMQNHYNLVYREEEREMMPLCEAEGIGIIPWSPLARGFLVGNRSKSGGGETTRAKTDDFAQDMYYNDSDFEIVDRVVELAGKRDVAPAQIALAWLLNKSYVTAPIIGASKMPQLDQAVGALEIIFSEEEMAYLEEPYQPHPILGHS
jgi:aryl-alcohol dehydrogenase (NADP+)